MKTNLLDMSPDELKRYLSETGEPAYRAGQIYRWLVGGFSFSEMTNLPKKTREALDESCVTGLPDIAAKYVSSIDGTVKYLFECADGERIESVVMKYKHGNTICISSQAGCRMGCRFCASTLNGLSRNLTPGELLGQVVTAQRDTGERISNIVMMGIGEPLDNWDNVKKFLHLVNLPESLNIGYRHISLSTCGLADKIRILADEGLPITLSVSLHAPSDEERSVIMPVNKKWSIEKLMDAVRYYFERTGRRISFEYTLIEGVNDTPDTAHRLAKLIKSYFPTTEGVHVNLIPVNPVAERGFRRSGAESVRVFCDLLGRHGITATVRRHLGADIDASCGQLRAGKKPIGN